jgi:phytoene synthase
LPAVCRDLATLALGHFTAAEAAMSRASRRAMRPAAVRGAFYRAMLDALLAADWRDPTDRVSLGKGRKLWLVLRHGFL